ncbi:MLO-like protein 13 [Nicotiana tabacum]|uniref:MLO-like protein n=2 Tax=Nicotiana TaxID=4085 RepID=A0A1S4A228_TOBAC|nr:MLO-like protein 13 isoform X1 [Nicotiana tomentosiformis]XP_016470649.1 PREDICTED: MLO-like protein 13 [Nicotiana tabacum]
MAEEESRSLEYTPTWVIAVVCFVIVLISLIAERGLHRLGKFFRDKKQDALFEALQKLKEELMLLGFISLLLTVFQGLVSQLCIPENISIIMLPCTLKESGTSNHLTATTGRHLLAGGNGVDHCSRHKGQVPLLSLEALHQLHIFIFVLALTHVVFCATTMALGVAKIQRQWGHWEHSIQREPRPHHVHILHLKSFMDRAGRRWRKYTVVSWTVAFFKQFYGSVTKSDYIVLRSAFIREHCPTNLKFDFHKYMMRTLEHDFKKIVGISWYLWLFVVLFLLMNIAGWHTYFWLSFLPLVLLLLVGTKLEHIITELAQEVAERSSVVDETTPVRPSDELFWFHSPTLVLYLIHFILFQNSFEIAFFVWIWCTYGFKSCIMEELGFIIPRLVIGVIVQVLCSYSTLPLYALVTQMGSRFKKGIFDQQTEGLLRVWATGGRAGSSTQNKMAMETLESICVSKRPAIEGISSTVELSYLNNHHTTP